MDLQFYNTEILGWCYVDMMGNLQKDPDKVSETDIHLHTEETESSNTVMERELFLSSMETQVFSSLSV